MALTGQQYVIAAGAHEATLVEVGAGLRSYRHAGVDVTATYGDDMLPPNGAGAVLVPWPNRLRGGRYTFDGVDQQLALTEPTAGNAIHGLARWVRWAPLRFDAASITLGCDLVPQTGWPFEVRVALTYALDAESGLTVTLAAANTGATRAPFGAGFHPYLSARGHQLADTVLRIPARQRLVQDEVQVPIGIQTVEGTSYDFRRARRLDACRLDDGFTGLRTEHGQGTAELRTPTGGARLWFDKAFGYLQVFTLETFPGGGGAAVAIEPMTCAADAFNSGDGLIVLPPGAEWRAAWGIIPM